MFELKVKSHFAGAHQLTMVGRKCENLHGHNWNVEVCVIGKKLNSAGVVADFGDIKKAVREVIGELDHRFLNELGIFEDHQPTSERIAVYIAQRVTSLLQSLPKDIKVSKVMAWESENACATYFPDRG
jgi:6-pyruvoyltetrahydropterin/6-carboxytetrahydropterin synthase